MTSKISCYAELAARWYVFLLLTIYGSGKLLGGQFYQRGNLPEEIATLPLSEVTGFDLAWAFMGYSYAYILFIGISQLIGAILLLFERTKLIGTMILIPILVNIVVFDAIFFDTYGALASATLYLLLLCLILFFNKERIVNMITILVSNKTNPGAALNIKRAKTMFFVALFIAFLFGVDQFFVNLLGH